MDDLDFPSSFTIKRWIIGAVVFILLLNGGLFLTHSLWFQTVQAPIARQNLNHDPNWQRQVEANYQTSYADFIAAQQSLPGKIAAVAAFEKAHPNASTWDYWTQQRYQTLYNDAAGDYQAEITEADTYNALVSDADTGPLRPKNLPAHLTPDPQPNIP